MSIFGRKSGYKKIFPYFDQKNIDFGGHKVYSELLQTVIYIYD